MLTAEAHVHTDRPSRYLVQLCRHADRMRHHVRHQAHADAPPDVRHIEWSATHGTVVLNWGRWTLRAEQDTLTVRVEAAKNDDLRRIQDLLTRRIEKIGRRDHLTVTWLRPDTAPPGDIRQAEPLAGKGTGRRPRAAGWVLVAVAAVFLAVHLGLGGVVLAAPSWTLWTVIGVGALLLLKITVLCVLAARRRHHKTQASGRQVGLGP